MSGVSSDENRRLIEEQPREQQPNQDHSSVPNTEVARAITDTTFCTCSINTKRVFSLAWMLICLLLGVVFLVAGKVHTDTNALHINGLHVYRCLTVFLFISIVWMCQLIFQKHIKRHVAEKRWKSQVEPRKQLLPRRLLVGVMFFGLGSSFMTMVEFLEFLVEYECESQEFTLVIYYFIRTVFTYVQLYFFYKLTSESEKILVYGHFLMMHLVAVNLATWIVTFVHDSAEELKSSAPESTPDEELSSFMLNHWGVNMSAVNTTKACIEKANDLKTTAKTMEPYFYTFTMEYCLISAGLLLNVWLTLAGPTAQEPEARASPTESEDYDILETVETESVHEVGTLWRFGFILGLVYVPMFAAIIFNILFTDTEEEDKLIYVGFQLFFFLSILVASVYGSVQLNVQEPGKIHSKVDFYLLGAALVGVFFLDLFIVVASFCEVAVSTPLAVMLIFTNIMELMCSIAFTQFVYKALQRKLPSVKDQSVLYSAGQIREVVSFLFMLNICFWAMYTFEVKKSDRVLALMETFYTRKIWFYISHFVYPLAVFFHFHGAVCMVEILDTYSKVPVKNTNMAAGQNQQGQGQNQQGQGQIQQGRGKNQHIPEENQQG